jgi:hypothetical protein
MLFDFNTPNSGYDLAGLQTAVADSVGGQTSAATGQAGGLQSVVVGNVRGKAQANDRSVQGNMGFMLRWVSSIARWNS